MVTCFHYKDSRANIILYKLDHSFNNDCNGDDVLKALVCSSNSIDIESLCPPLNSSFTKQNLHLRPKDFFNCVVLIRNDALVGVLQMLCSWPQEGYLQHNMSSVMWHFQIMMGIKITFLSCAKAGFLEGRMKF